MKIFDCGGICRRKDKTRLLSWLRGLDPTIKWKLIMRINFVAFFLLFTMMHVSASVHAQKITLSIDKAPLKAVFIEIEKQSGFEVWYNNNLLKDTKPVSIKMSADLKSVLDKVFTDQPLTYEIVDKTIVIKRKPVSVVEKITKFIKAIKITGTVTDEKGNPLVGVTVRLKGTSTTTVTGRNGKYIIEVPDENAILQFSYVGFQTVEQIVQGNQKVDMSLKEAISKLDEFEVVSTGYQTLPKERATGSFVQINNDLLNRRISTNILERLDGITPGVFFNGTTKTTVSTVLNNPNYGITIRGQNSFSSTTAQPLIVVDNFPYEGEISNINPNDIESITILKDAAAASIWGARSGNGVIVITTKKGAKNQKMKVELNTSVTVIQKPDLFYNPGFLNPDSYISAEKNLFDAGFFNSDMNNKSTRPTVSPAVEIFAKQRSGTISAAEAEAQLNGLRGNDVRRDFDKYFYRQGVNQQYALGIRGGSENLAYYLSAGYDKNLASLTENSYNRISVNSTNTYTPVKNLDITAGINYSQNKSTENNDFAYKQFSTVGTKYGSVFPYARLADVSGNALAIPNGIRLSYLDEMEANGFLDWHYRPLDDIRSNDNNTKINDLLLRISGKYKILPELSVELLYQNERQLIDRKNYKSQETYYTRNLINKFSSLDASTGKINYIFPLGGILTQGRYDWISNNFRGQLDYQKKFAKHEVNAIAGAEIREIKSDGSSRLAYGYEDQFGTSVSTLDFLTNYPTFPSGSARIPSLPSDISGFLNRYISYYANAGYTYNDKYTLTLSGRKDGANLFGVNTNERITPLWSAGAGWDISKEPFYQSNLMPYLRLRASYGFNGNVNREGTAFLTGTYTTDPITGARIITGATAPNPDLRWEKIKNINIGIDFATKNNVIRGTLEGYYKNGFDLFQQTDLAPQTGFTRYNANTANSRSKGIDLSLQTNNVNGVLQWSSTLLLSWVKEKILKYDVPLNTNSISSGRYVGYPMFSMFSYKWEGLNPENGNPRGFISGAVSEDYASIINNYTPDSLVFNGSLRPTVFGSIRNDFTFKGFNLSINIVYKLGYVFRRSTTSLNLREVIFGGHEDYNKRWIKPGDEAFTDIPSVVYPNNTNRNTFYQYSEATVEKGDHIRLQDIRFGYSFSDRILRSTFLKQLRLFAYCNNVGILWRKNDRGIDPDAGIYPNPRSFALGLSTNF
jgi:TonB-linked outer membrane protein, SusC/RagA family